MQLKFNKSINKSVIHIELETTNFTVNENSLLDRFGEPRIIINKKYLGLFPVDIDRTIRTGFKVRVKFDGKDNDTTKAAEAATEFYEEVKSLIADRMNELQDKEFDVNYENKSGLESIKY